MSDRAMLDIAATVWGEKIRPMQATIEMQLSAISELQRENDRLREAIQRAIDHINEDRNEMATVARLLTMLKAALTKEAGK